jgi:hypothetical protein
MLAVGYLIIQHGAGEAGMGRQQVQTRRDQHGLQGGHEAHPFDNGGRQPV